MREGEGEGEREVKESDERMQIRMGEMKGLGRWANGQMGKWARGQMGRLKNDLGGERMNG